MVAGGRAIGPGRVFSGDGQSLYDLDPAMFNLVQSLFVDQAIDRADMIQILESARSTGRSPPALGALETLTMPQNEARLEHARLRGGAGQRRGAGQSRPTPLSGPAVGQPGGPDRATSCGPRRWTTWWTSGSTARTCRPSTRPCGVELQRGRRPAVWRQSEPGRWTSQAPQTWSKGALAIAI